MHHIYQLLLLLRERNGTNGREISAIMGTQQAWLNSFEPAVFSNDGGCPYHNLIILSRTGQVRQLSLLDLQNPCSR